MWTDQEQAVHLFEQLLNESAEIAGAEFKSFTGLPFVYVYPSGNTPREGIEDRLKWCAAKAMKGKTPESCDELCTQNSDVLCLPCAVSWSHREKCSAVGIFVMTASVLRIRNQEAQPQLPPLPQPPLHPVSVRAMPFFGTLICSLTLNATLSLISSSSF